MYKNAALFNLHHKFEVVVTAREKLVFFANVNNVIWFVNDK